ncbi:hypothetical protein SK128_019887, partial [Halocaridina rubra]
MKTVMLAGSRPDEESSFQEDMDMEGSQQGGSAAVSSSGANMTTFGIVTLPATGGSVSGGSAVSLSMPRLVSSGNAMGSNSLLHCQLRHGAGGQRGRPPHWSKLPLYRRHRKGCDGKEEEEDSNTCSEGVWTSPTLPKVALEFLSNVSPEAAEAFSLLFSNPASTAIPVFTDQTLDMMGNFAHAVYV